MSLINDVLRDLDARGADRPAGTRRPNALERATSRRRRRRLALAVLACLAAAGFAAVALRLDLPAGPPLPTVSAAPPSGSDPESGPASKEAAGQPPRAGDATGLLDPPPASISPQEAGDADAIAVLPATRQEFRLERTPRPLTPRQRAASAFRRALALEQGGDPVAARAELRFAVEQDPRHHEARLTLAMLDLRAGEPERALEVVEAGRAVAPSHLAFVELAARIHLEAGRTDAAVELLESAAERQTLPPETRAFLAALLQRSDRHERAIELYGQALRQDPSQARWWLGLAISLEAEGRQAEATAAYRGATRTRGLDRASRRFAEARMTRLAEAEE